MNCCLVSKNSDNFAKFQPCKRYRSYFSYCLAAGLEFGCLYTAINVTLKLANERKQL